MNPTNDPTLRSWVPVAPESHFPIQNLPYGVFQRRFRRPDDRPHIGVAIGDMILDLHVLAHHHLLERESIYPSTPFLASNLNTFLATGSDCWSEMRSCISRLLQHDNPVLRDD